MTDERRQGEPRKRRDLQGGGLDPHARDFYIRTIRLLHGADIDLMIGGAYAFGRYTGIERHTKDLDVFVRRADSQRTLKVLADAGYETDLTFPHWLGKAHAGEDFIDVIFSSGNGVADVDDAWFEHAEQDEVFGEPVLLCPPEEMIWQKAFVMERERYDGADVAHLLRACAEHIDWTRLVSRFGPHWRVLLAHLTMFGFIYPSERSRVPPLVMRELLGRLDGQLEQPHDEKVCQGTLISRSQYLPDVGRWGYRDARITQDQMTRSDVAHWTAAMDKPQ